MEVFNFFEITTFLKKGAIFKTAGRSGERMPAENGASGAGPVLCRASLRADRSSGLFFIPLCASERGEFSMRKYQSGRKLGRPAPERACGLAARGAADRLEMEAAACLPGPIGAKQDAKQPGRSVRPGLGALRRTVQGLGPMAVSQ